MSMGEKDTSEVLGSLQGKGDHFTKLSVTERKRVSDLEDAVTHISAETEKYRSWAKKSAIDVMNLHVLTPNPAFSRADGVDVGRQAAAVTSKVLTILEMNLNKLLVRQSEIIIQNKALKTDVNHYRCLRQQTNVSHRKFELLLSQIKLEIEERLAESAAIVEERERLVEEKEILEKENLEEQEIFRLEYEEMGEYIKVQNTALEESLLKERKEDQKKSKPNGKKEEEVDVAAEAMKSKLTVDEEVEMAKQMGSYTKFAESEEIFLQGIEDKIDDYKKMFEELKKMTSAESLEEVVSTYVAQEDEMFSLYNFVQAMNAEIDTIHEQTLQQEIEISNFKLNQEEEEAGRRSVLESQQTRLQTAEENKEKEQELNTHHHESMMQLSKKISNVFFKLQCDQMDAKNPNKGEGAPRAKAPTVSRPERNVQLLTSQGVSESNVLEFLGCIEQRAVDVIGDYLRMKAAEGDAPPGFLRSPTPGPQSPCAFTGTEPVIDFNELLDDDFLVGGGDDGPEVLVDMVSFKNKLKSKFEANTKQNHK